jgi:hypothetical protein
MQGFFVFFGSPHKDSFCSLLVNHLLGIEKEQRSIQLQLPRRIKCLCYLSPVLRMRTYLFALMTASPFKLWEPEQCFPIAGRHPALIRWLGSTLEQVYYSAVEPETHEAPDSVMSQGLSLFDAALLSVPFSQ